MRLIDAEGSELQTQLKIIREAEYQIYGSGSWGFTAKCEHAIEDAPTVQPEITHEQAVAYLQSTGWMQEHDRQMMLDGVHRLTAQPTIQPKRGKWIRTARWGRVYYCDQCRNYLDFDGVNAGRGSTNFCPNCGAKMEVNNESN